VNAAYRLAHFRATAEFVITAIGGVFHPD